MPPHTILQKGEGQEKIDILPVKRYNALDKTLES
jgi:hypothetical protein